MSLPTFIIPGAHKSGTTALWAYLDEHPQICMSRPKEPHFFTKVEGVLGTGVKKPGYRRPLTWNRGLAWYKSLFQDCGNVPFRGEASADYFSAPDSPALIKAFIPDVRLVILLRDPVDRLYSHYWHDQRLGYDFPDFEMSVRENHLIFQYYFDISRYRMHLENFFAEFSMDQTLILLHSDLNKEPVETLRKVYRFIGCDPDFLPSSIGKRFNPQMRPKFRRLERMINEFRCLPIIQSLPDRYRRRLGEIRQYVSKAWMVTVSSYPPMRGDLRRELIRRMEPDIRYVEKLLDRDLGSWRRV